MIRRLVIGLFALAAALFAAASMYVASRQHLRFDAPYPRIAYATDSATIARGRYIVRQVADCGGCHVDPAQRASYTRGEEVPLSGGFSWDIPPGTIYARNITPDRETGIGVFGDSAVARALRYGVGHDGRALLPFMDKQNLSDEDVAAVVAYIGHQASVRHVVPAHRFSLLGMVVKATLLASPVGPSGTPSSRSPRGATVENGRYLVEAVADCGGCHTRRDPRTGAVIGQPLAGTTDFAEKDSPGKLWSPPNITSGGRLAALSENQFIARFRAGRAIPGSPMPWQAFQKLEEDDLRAIYRYLMTVPKSMHDVGPPFVEKKTN